MLRQLARYWRWIHGSVVSADGAANDLLRDYAEKQSSRHMVGGDLAGPIVPMIQIVDCLVLALNPRRWPKSPKGGRKSSLEGQRLSERKGIVEHDVAGRVKHQKALD